MKILVTGANGFLGAGVVKELSDAGAEVVAADFSVERVDARAEAVACDAFSLEDPYTYFGKPDVLLHMAWRNGFVHNADTHLADLPLHAAFLKKMLGGGLGQLAVMGTMHEVGRFEGCIREDTPTHPESLYGISKDALRNTAKLLCKNAGAVFQWLRGYYIVSASTFGSSIFSKLSAAEKQGQALFPFTTGQNQYDFLDYDEFCRQVAASVMQSEIDGIINVCSGRPQPLCDRVERFIRENGFSIRLDYGKYPDRPYDSKAVWGDDTKIRAILSR